MTCEWYTEDIIMKYIVAHAAIYSKNVFSVGAKSSLS